MVPGAWWWPNSQIIEKFLFHFILFLGSDSGAGLMCCRGLLWLQILFNVDISDHTQLRNFKRTLTYYFMHTSVI